MEVDEITERVESIRSYIMSSEFKELTLENLEEKLNSIKESKGTTLVSGKYLVVPASSVKDNLKLIDNRVYVDRLLKRKRMLLHGAPGTGKTVLSKVICRCIEEQTGKNVYYLLDVFIDKQKEDIVGGITFDTDGKVVWQDGSLTYLCKEAIEHDENIYVYIIDEINRSDAMVALGVFTQAIEQVNCDVNLASGQSVHVPENLYIIATMNDYDKGAKNLDFALLSRFTSLKVESILYADNFIEQLKITDTTKRGLEKISKILEILNELRSVRYATYGGEPIELGVREMLAYEMTEAELFGLIRNDILNKLRQLVKQSKDEDGANKLLDNIKSLCDESLGN